ncbi:histidinol-phosphate transaminase [Arenimonas alkanexedens]
MATRKAPSKAGVTAADPGARRLSRGAALMSDAADFAARAQPGIQDLRAYDPGLDLVALRRRFAPDHLVELGSNENSHGPSPRARGAILDALHSLHRYPDPLGGELKRALAARHGVDVAGIVLGNGSHELLMLMGQVFAGPGRGVVASQYGFAVYALAAQAAGARLVEVPAQPADADMPRGHDLDALSAAIAPDTSLVFLANPNNPTGTWFSTEALARLLAGVPAGVLVVVDEAYLEYVTDPALGSAIALLPRFPNLVVTRTFSKGYGLAGLRVGYLLAAPGLAAVLERVRESFNVNGPGLAAAAAALEDEDHLAWVCRQNAVERESLADALSARGLSVAPSQTNFLLVDFGREAGPVAAGLVARGVVPRPMAGYGLPTCLRLTVGLRDENRRLLQALDEVLA